MCDVIVKVLISAKTVQYIIIIIEANENADDEVCRSVFEYTYIYVCFNSFFILLIVSDVFFFLGKTCSTSGQRDVVIPIIYTDI